jgi:muramoyltetrapeptide carboxypeptidase
VIDWIRPPRLSPGATLGVAAVSGPVDPGRLSAGVRALEALGYRIVLAPNIQARRDFLAGSDSERAAGYRELLANPSVDAIFFARGGYGASRILRFLDPREIRERPRIHLGGSDVTALFGFLGVQAGLVTMYGPMVAVSLAQGGMDWESVLRGETPATHRFDGGDVLSGGTGSGPLRGGCLSLLASMAGTPEAVSGDGAVLFWEDVAEPLYRLDRMLTQLERSGTFDRLQAMIIGSISTGATGGGDSPEAVSAWLRERFAGAPFPVVRGFPAGHLEKTRTLPLGVTVRLDASAGTLAFDGPGVA